MQNSGNPVLDSLVNIMAERGYTPYELEECHEVLMKLAAKEPGGFKHDIVLEDHESPRDLAMAFEQVCRGCSGGARRRRSASLQGRTASLRRSARS